MADPTFKFLGSVTSTGGGQTTLTLSSIPQTGTDLLIIGTLKTATTDTSGTLAVSTQVNGANPTGGAVQVGDNSGGSGGQNYFNAYARNSWTSLPANDVSSFRMYIANYSSTVKAKQFTVQYGCVSGVTNPPTIALGGGWYNTLSAVTSFSLVAANPGFVTGSSYSVYSITKFA